MLKREARWLLIVLLIVALLLRQGLIVLLLGLIGLALVITQLWARWAFRRVEYQRMFSSDRAFVGDEVQFMQRIANAKLLGLPSLHISDDVPTKLELVDGRLLPHTQPYRGVLRRWIALRPYEAVTWSTTIRCRERGYYAFGPAHLEVSDAFGLETRELDLPERQHLLVYPQLIVLPNLHLRAQHPIGDARTPRQLLTDLARTMGVRDYRRDDPLKAIHWGATAKRGELQTRIYEPTTSLDVAIVLDLDTFEYYWEGIRYDLIEYMISAAATVATTAAHDRLRFGLYSNGAPADSGQLVRMPPSRSPAQLPLALEMLAKLVPHSVTSMPNLLRRIGPELSWGATIVLISAVASTDVQTALLRLKGRRIVWLYANEDRPPEVPGIEVVPLSLDTHQWSDQRSHQSFAAVSV